MRTANLVSSNAVRSVRRRGNLSNGANGGARYVNANNAPSNANANYGGGLSLTQSRTWRSAMRNYVRCINIAIGRTASGAFFSVVRKN